MRERNLEKVVQQSFLAYGFNKENKEKLKKIISECDIRYHKKRRQITPQKKIRNPGAYQENLYYVINGCYLEKYDLFLQDKFMTLNQDLITQDQIFGEEFLTYDPSNYWEALKDSTLLIIPPQKQNEMIQKMQSVRCIENTYNSQIQENLKHLKKEKIDRLTSVSKMRYNKLNQPQKIYYLLDFLSNQPNSRMLNYDSEYFQTDRIYHSDLSRFIGTSRENTNRVLNKNNLIKFSSGKMYIRKNFKEILLKEES